MCGRFVLHSDATTLAAQFGVTLDFAPTPRYNIAPSQPLLAIRDHEHRREATHLNWGLLPGWAKDAATARRPINARAETVADKPSFRNAWRRRRCLVPADGYYEWVKQAGGKQPVYISATDGGCFALAGLWEYWERDGSAIESCCLLTCAANSALAPYHHRMPVIIEVADYATWLARDAAPGDLTPLLAPAAPDRLRLHAVSKRVNSPAHDEPACIEADAGAELAPGGS